jgi:hypothetical protein
MMSEEQRRRLRFVLGNLDAGKSAKRTERRQTMATLFSYCLPFDDGAAPNPFWGLCTLAICKPVIRRTAKVGDWVVGTGSRRSPIGDLSGQVVYAMRVTEVMTMQKYDQFTRSTLSNKIPQMDHADRRRWYGDSIYDYSTTNPSLRPGVHSEKNRRTDLSGDNVLLSDAFFYFGDRPVDLPLPLRAIAQQQQGHRSLANVGYFDAFVDWIERLKSEYPFAVPIGNPQWWELADLGASCETCTPGRREEAEADREMSVVPLNHPCSHTSARRSRMGQCTSVATPCSSVEGSGRGMTWMINRQCA